MAGLASVSLPAVLICIPYVCSADELDDCTKFSVVKSGKDAWDGVPFEDEDDRKACGNCNRVCLSSYLISYLLC